MAMRSEAQVRTAEPSDAGDIVRTLRSALDPVFLPYTIVASPGVERFVHDSLVHQGPRSGVFYTVAERLGEVLGFTEFRRDMRRVFLNHIHVREEARGAGLGRQLLRESIRTVRDHRQSEIALDVFASNERAHRWYRSLGFAHGSSSEWVVTELPPAEPGFDRGHLEGLPMAELAMDRYGFCNFQLNTPRGSYRIGRIGPHLFRTTRGDLLEDRDALSLLWEMDSGGTLVCISEEPILQARHPFQTRVVGTSHRLEAEADGVLAALTEPNARATDDR